MPFLKNLTMKTKSTVQAARRTTFKIEHKMRINLSKMIDISKFAVSKLASVTNLMTSAKKIPQSDKHISS